MAYPSEYFNSTDDYKKHVDNLNKKDFFSELRNDYPVDSEIARTKKLLKYLIVKKEKN